MSISVADPTQKTNRGAKEKSGPVEGLTREVYLEQRAAGETIDGITKAWGVKGNTMYYWVNKWGLKGMSEEQSRELINNAAEGVTKPVVLQDSKLVPDPVSEKVIQELLDRITDYESELARWAQVDSENSVLLVEMQEDRDNWKQQAAINRSERDAFEQERNKILLACTMLEDERQLLLATIEKAVTPEAITAVYDNVNRPVHYTAGGIECIDAIEAAVINLPGAQAYSVGASIKYLWRYSRKNGVEDLQKAAWYVNRLIREVGHYEQAK